MPLITDPDGLRGLLRMTRSIAIVGWSPNPTRPSYSVAAYLRAAGYRVFPVNPEVGTPGGEPAYCGLHDIPVPIDIVTVFRRPEFVPAVVEATLSVGAKALWLQDGVIHARAAEQAVAAGLLVVMDRCIRRDHRQLLAGSMVPSSTNPPVS